MTRLIAVLFFAAATLLLGFWIGRRHPDVFPQIKPPGAADESAALSGEYFWTCGMHPQVVRDKPGICPMCPMKLERKRKGESVRGAGVTIDPVIVQNMGLRTEPAAKGRLRSRVRATGFFHEAEPLQRDVSLKVQGWVEVLHAATEGIHLRKGDPLLELYSPQLLTAQEELLAAKRGLDRLGATADAATKADATRFLEAARQKMQLWDVDPKDLVAIEREGTARKLVTFRSPVDGHLVEKKVVPGSAVTPGEKLFRIVDHSSLWLEIQIFESQMAHVRLGGEVEASVLAFPGRTWRGVIRFIHPHVSESTRTLTVRIGVENPEFTLKPGMYARVEIVPSAAEETVLVAREAVIDTGSRQLVFVAGKEGRFEPRDVKVGLEGEDGRVQILSGLLAGEPVVVSGQFLLDTESRLREAQRKLSDQGLHGKPDLPALPPLDDDARTKLGRSLEPILSRYLDLQGALAAANEKSARFAADAVARTADALRALEGPASPLARLAAEAAQNIAIGDIHAIRDRFKALSAVMIPLVDASGSPEQLGSLDVLHCPMVKGRWLQSSGPVRNPYDERMPTCGDVERTIVPESRARVPRPPAETPEAAPAPVSEKR